MAGAVEEWFGQADYDLDTAVFMAHLAVEKALKGVYHHRLGKVPPETHNLVHLLDAIGIVSDPSRRLFLANLTSAQIRTRYPEDIARLQAEFDVQTARGIIADAKEAVSWAKTQR